MSCMTGDSLYALFATGLASCGVVTCPAGHAPVPRFITCRDLFCPGFKVVLVHACVRATCAPLLVLVAGLQLHSAATAHGRQDLPQLVGNLHHIGLVLECLGRCLGLAVYRRLRRCLRRAVCIGSSCCTSNACVPTPWSYRWNECGANMAAQRQDPHNGCRSTTSERDHADDASAPGVTSVTCLPTASLPESKSAHHATMMLTHLLKGSVF